MMKPINLVIRQSILDPTKVSVDFDIALQELGITLRFRAHLNTKFYFVYSVYHDIYSSPILDAYDVTLDYIEDFRYNQVIQGIENSFKVKMLLKNIRNDMLDDIKF